MVQGQKASSSSREEAGGRGGSGGAAGPRVDYNFDHLDRERYSHSKKKLEVRKSEKLAAALSVFDSGCDVEVTGFCKGSVSQKQVFLSTIKKTFASEIAMVKGKFNAQKSEVLLRWAGVFSLRSNLTWTISASAPLGRCRLYLPEADFFKNLNFN